MKKYSKTYCLSSALFLALSFPAHAATVSAFSENFEGSLSAWTDRNLGSPESVIVADPLRAGNHVLSFTRLGSGGSIFTTDTISSTGLFTVSFEYLGLAKSGSVAGNNGGFFGISQAFPGNHYWVAGTIDGYGPIDLIDDNTWHTYNLTFSSPIGQTVHLMYEDFVGSGGVVGDVYFDNIRFNDAAVAPAPFNVPEPGIAVMLLTGIGMMGFITRRRSHKEVAGA